MAFELTENVRQEIETGIIKPNLVLGIDGVAKKYGAILIKKYVRVGDTDLEIGDPDINPDAFYVGGFNLVDDQSDLISLSQGTTTQIRQSLRQDKGTGEDISSMQIALVDVNNEATELVTPDTTVSPAFDLLGRRTKLYLGLDNTAWKEDYIIVFRGLIDNIDSGSNGLITINMIHPDTLKRTDIFIKNESDLTSNITDIQTNILIDDTTDFLNTILGPDGSFDSATQRMYVKINDEIIEYVDISGNNLQGCIRGSLGTTAVAHNSGDNVETLYQLTGNVIDLALKVMLSGGNGPFETGVSATNFLRISPTLDVANSIFFDQVNLVTEYNLQVGDFISTTGATNGANNVTLKEIDGIVITEDNSTYITVDGVTFVLEVGTSVSVDFRSQYDTLGEGLNMKPEEVDIAEHVRIKSLFLSSFSYNFYFDDTVNGREFINEQLYNPAGAFSIPRKAQSSIGYHAPPLPDVETIVLDSDNIKNPSKIKISRSTSKNFFNSIIYRFDKQTLEDKYSKSLVTINSDSVARIPIGNKPLTMKANGLRTSLNAVTLATNATSKRLKKYKFGAELVKGLKLQYATGYRIEIGDIVILDMTSLKMTDIASGTRAGESRLFEIQNKAINIKTGDIAIDLLDTSFDKDTRYALISHSSVIKSGISTTKFIIQESYNSPHGQNEYKKWLNSIGTGIKIHNNDFSVSGISTIASIDGNEITLTTALAFTPTAGLIFELNEYDTQIDNNKLIYGAMTDNATFADSKVQYQMI